MKKLIQILIIVPAISFSQQNIKAINAGIKDYPSLVSDMECTWCSGKIPVGNFSSSSNLKSEGKVNYDIKNINDVDLRTVWSEGNANDGVGEFIELIISSETEFGSDNKDGFNGQFFIMNGHFKNDAAFKNNSRVKSFKVYHNGFPVCTVQLLDIRTFQIFDLKSAIKSLKAGDKLKFEIVDIYPGLKFKDVVITELIGEYEYKKQ
ncbi:MAG: hypothetical protein Q8K60_03445 [Parachlamydiaceae bacterium]|nr:hypothetical protein [Parachlamydiaceae bacterium]